VIPEELFLLWVGKYWSLAIWDSDAQLLAGTFTGASIGLAGSYFAHNDKLYACGKCRICRNSNARRGAGKWLKSKSILPHLISNSANPFAIM
jgi:hypothetical protein